jgi:hypothetical protein
MDWGEKYTVTNTTIAKQRFGKDRLKAGIVEQESMSVARQRFDKHVPVTTDRMTTFRGGCLYSVLPKL